MATGQLWLRVTAVTSMHSPALRERGRRIVRLQLPAALAGAPQVTGVGLGAGVGDADGEGDGDGDGLGDAEGEGDGLGDGDGDAPGDGDAEGEGDGDGEAEGEADGDGDGDGVVPGATLTCTVAVACDVPERATRLKLVVHSGRTWRVPFASTTPTPLSISTRSAPVTSQVSVVGAPEEMSAGVARKRWMDSVVGSLTSPVPHRTRTSPSPASASGPRTRRGRRGIPGLG
jgi:hypothetical protein